MIVGPRVVCVLMLLIVELRHRKDGEDGKEEKHRIKKNET